MFESFLVTLILAGVVVAAILLAIWLFAKNYVKVPPNTVAVFTGRGEPKTVRGGARFRMPLIERVDMMDLTPFNVDVTIQDVYSSDSVPVNVTAVGLIRFGSSPESLATAVQRFLTSDRQGLAGQVKEILAGALRNIVSQLTVEELNNNRDELSTRVLAEAAKSFGPIGMELDVLTIQNISDKVGYLEALGKKRTAEVKAHAEIGQAEADRDSKIRSAQARQAGEIAAAKSEQAIADAQQELELRRAKIQEEVDAAKATASQAGPLAAAEARRKVDLANVATEKSKTEAEIEVEQQRAKKAHEATQADIVIPAQAARQAAIEEAEGAKAAAIAAGLAEEEKRKAAARALLEELTAQADGKKADLLAQAAGQTELAKALALMDDQALRVQAMPLLIEALPKIAKEYATPLGNIDNLTVVDGGGNGDGNALTRFAGSTATQIPQLFAQIKALTGFDLSDLLSGGSSSTSSSGPVTVDAGVTQSRDNNHVSA